MSRPIRMCLIMLATAGFFGAESFRINPVKKKVAHGARHLTSDQRDTAYTMNEQLLSHTIKQVLASVKNFECPWESFDFDGKIEVVNNGILSIKDLRVDNINLHGLDLGNSWMDKVEVKLNRLHGERDGFDGEWFLKVKLSDMKLEMKRKLKNAMRIYYKPRGLLGRAFVPKRVLEPEVEVNMDAELTIGIDWSFDDEKKIYVPKFKLMAG